jgi:hypothetical protein
MTDLLQVVEDGVETAFTTLKDFVVLGTYMTRGSEPVYDPETDSMTYVAQNFENVRIIRTAASMEEREASTISINDVKFLIPATDLPGYEPTETDVVDYGGVLYNVLAIKHVPGDSLWIIMAREK